MEHFCFVIAHDVKRETSTLIKSIIRKYNQSNFNGQNFIPVCS